MAAYIEYLKFEGNQKLTVLTINYFRKAVTFYYIFIPILLILSVLFYHIFFNIKFSQYKKVLYFLGFWMLVQNFFPIIPIIILFLFFNLHLADIIQLAINPGAFPLWYTLFISIFILAGTILSYYIFRKNFDKKDINNFGYTFQINLKKACTIGILTGFLFIFIGFLILYSFGLIGVIRLQFKPLHQLLYIIFFAVVAINEEILFRGYILETLLEKGNKYMALLISALLFAIFHSANPNITWLSFVNLIIAGIFIGIFYLYERNLWLVTSLHFSWNYFQGPVFGFSVSGLKFNGIIEQPNLESESIITGGNFGLEGSILLTGLMVVLTICAHVYYNRKTYNSKTNTLNFSVSE